MGSKQTYRDSPRMEDQEELLASPDLETSSNGEHKTWQDLRDRSSLGGSCLSALRQYLWLIITAMLGAIILLQLIIWDQLSNRSQERLPQVGGDYLRKGPIFPTEVIKWNPDPEFTPLNASEFLNPKVQAKWETLIPAGAGFVGEEAYAYNSTSVTHQLHCVYIMGKIFSAVLTNSPDLPEPNDYEAHFLHCVDYMRQAAMCAGDLTIEPRGENGKPGPINLINAFNGLHVCKSYDQVKGYLEEQVRDGARNILPLDD